jgi:hypothetical protein
MDGTLEQVRTAPGAYAICTSRDIVDAHRFDDVVATGTAHLLERDLVEAEASLALGQVESITDRSVSTWLQRYGYDGPALRWTTRLDHLEQLDKAFDLLMASADYHAAVAEADELFIGPVVDELFEVVSGTPPTAPTSVASTVQATAANGQIRVEGTHAKMAADDMLQAVIDEGAHNCQPGATVMLMHKLD